MRGGNALQFFDSQSLAKAGYRTLPGFPAAAEKYHNRNNN
jgi:hypothetical protein